MGERGTKTLELKMVSTKHIEAGTKVAKYTNVRKAKVSAVAFSGTGQIIATAHNRRVDGHKNKWTEHAEEVIIHKLVRLKAFSRYDNISILVMRINKRGAAMARPCRKCQILLRQYRVSVYYTSENGTVKEF